MDQQKILVIDDEKDFCENIAKFLGSEGYKVFTSNNGEDALERVIECQPDLALLDIRMPGMDGMETLNRVRQFNNKLIVIILTAHQTERSAMEAIRLGAYDYLTKPCSLNKIKIMIENAFHTRTLTEEVAYLKGEVEEKLKYGNIIGSSKPMQRLYHSVERIAPADATVLIRGESGTGKELIARAIHDNSQRRSGRFLSIDCASLPQTLVESELFGYEKGAFTGAYRRKLGKFELAHRGTLFLDEIGNLPLETQVKLLRVLQERVIERLGGKEPVRIDVRLVTATNKDLMKAIKKGAFREDLYYRLNVCSITLPLLRERRSDIPLLAEHFIASLNKTHSKNIRGISPQALRLLLDYNWPGNVRELKNTVESAVLMADDYIHPGDLPEDIRRAGSEGTMVEIAVKLKAGAPLKQVAKKVSQETEKNLIIKVLQETGGNKTRAATLLGIDYKSLYNKIKQYKIKGSEHIPSRLEISP